MENRRRARRSGKGSEGAEVGKQADGGSVRFGRRGEVQPDSPPVDLTRYNHIQTAPTVSTDKFITPTASTDLHPSPPNTVIKLT